MGVRAGLAVCGALFAASLVGPPAQAAFPGQNGKIAFVGSELGCSGACELNLYTVNPDGTGRTEDPGRPRWGGKATRSSDGASLVYAADRPGIPRDIYKINGNGSGGEVRLTTNPAIDATPAWSPSGARIAFSSDRSGTFDLWSMNSDGSNPTQLTSGPAMDFEPVFSPDGTKIAFTSTRNDPNPSCTVNCVYTIYVMDADGSDVTQVPISDAPELLADSQAQQSRLVPLGRPACLQLGRGSGLRRELEHDPHSDRSDPARRDRPVQSCARSSTGAGTRNRLGHRTEGGLSMASRSDARHADDQLETTARARAPVAEGEVPDWRTPSGATASPRPMSVSRARPPSAYRWSPPTTPLPPHPNRTHGPPLAFQSCNPPAPSSSRLTIGVGDGSPRLCARLGRKCAWTWSWARPGRPTTPT